MLAPGRTYRRQFAYAGTYTYTDGAGHTGTIEVVYKVYPPLALRSVP